jgi:hypothetical protein
VIVRAGDLPEGRPTGLRLREVDATWYRLDADPPDRWDWSAYPVPRNRFDPADGSARTRYAAGTARGAFRERFHDRGRILRERELGLNLVRLTGTVRLLDLRQESTLDRLGLDDEINVGRSARLLAASRLLASRVTAWYGERCHGLVYRSRTTPQTSPNLAFWEWSRLTGTDLGPARDHRGLLDALVVDDGFTIDA